MYRRPDCRAANPVAGAFIRNGESPATGAPSLTCGVAPVSDRSCACDHHHAGPSPESGFESDDRVSNDLHFAAYDLQHHSPSGRTDFRPTGAGQPNAPLMNLSRTHVGCGTRLLDRAIQRFAGLSFSNTDKVARDRSTAA